MEQDNRRHLGFECRTVANMVMRTVNERALFKESDALTGVQGLVIHFLYKHRDQDVCQRDIEKRFNVRRSTVTQTLRLMERNGLVVRSSVDGDARLKKLSLTGKAIQLHEKINCEIDKVEQLVLKGIPQADIDKCFEVLSKVKQNLVDMQNTIND